MFFVSHRVGILNHGHLVSIGHPDDVITESMLKKVYGIDVRIMHINSNINRKVCIPISAKEF